MSVVVVVVVIVGAAWIQQSTHCSILQSQTWQNLQTQECFLALNTFNVIIIS
jgi:hypothetical protein